MDVLWMFMDVQLGFSCFPNWHDQVACPNVKVRYLWDFLTPRWSLFTPTTIACRFSFPKRRLESCDPRIIKLQTLVYSLIQDYGFVTV